MELQLTPSAEVEVVGAAALVAYDWAWLWPWPPPPPPGLAIELRVQVGAVACKWALCVSTEVERGQLVAALRDAIDLSHGAGSPFETWAFGETLGAGTFGTVRAATKRATGERAAVKVLSLSALDRQCDAKKAIERERALMTRLGQLLPERAPLVRLLEFSTYGDALYFFLAPRCVGDLLGLLDKGAFSEANAAACTRGTLLAIAALHRAGVVHLDVKPQNLLYRTTDIARHSPTRFDAHGVAAEVLLADFGCARQLTKADGADKGSKAERGRLLPAARSGWRALVSDGGGTLYFTAPEILEESYQATSADVWAAGCVAFSLLHRRPPFVVDGESDEMCRLRILRGTPLWELPATHGSSSGVLAPLSRFCCSFLMRLFLRDWKERPSAEEALKDAWLVREDKSTRPQDQQGGGAEQEHHASPAPHQSPIGADPFAPFAVDWE